jgi:hypothetical protein
MKRAAVLILALFAVVNWAGAQDKNYIMSYTPIDAETVAASGTYTSSAIRLGWGQDQKVQPRGFFSVQVNLSGSGTAKIEFLCSNDGITFAEPDGAVDIVSGMTAGTKFLSFTPPVCQYLKIKATETGTSNSVTITARIAVQ